MPFFPRSLLWRTVLLLALLMVAGHFASLQIFRVAEREPRATQIAQQIASVVNLTRSALITGDPAKRLDLLRDLSQQEGIQVYAVEPSEPVEPLPDRPLTQMITLELQRRLGDDTKLLASRDSAHARVGEFQDRRSRILGAAAARADRARRATALGRLGCADTDPVGRRRLPHRCTHQPAAARTDARQRPSAAASRRRRCRSRDRPKSAPSSRAFNTMASDLKRADEDRALLLAGVSHDLRTPLSRIRLGVEMLNSEADAALKEGMVQDVEDIDAVINQFLDFARVTGEQSAAADINLNEVVNSVLERYRRQDKRVSARTGELPLMKIQALAIQRLLTNLIDNALRHGSEDVEIETAAGTWPRAPVGT